VRRSRTLEAFNSLAEYRTRMELAYNNNGNYGVGSCSVAVPSSAHFTLACTLEAGGQDFNATASGIGAMSGYDYGIDGAGRRSTSAFRGTAVAQPCGLQKGNEC
jgi:hypothetical protein